MNLRPEDLRLMQAWAQRLPPGDAQRRRIDYALAALLEKALHPDFVLAPHTELGRFWVGPVHSSRCVAPTTRGTAAALALVWHAARHGTAQAPDRRPNALRNAITGTAQSSVVQWLRRWPDCEQLAALLAARIRVCAAGGGSVVTYTPDGDDRTEIVTTW